MIEFLDTAPDIHVQPAEYQRLLGYPRHRVIEGRALELADGARAWYAAHGRPWVYARQAESLALTNGSILIDGTTFTSRRLQATLRQGEAHSVLLVAVSAGPELEAQAQKLWLEGKPDEYFFLEIFGSAVVEHLTTMTGARLCAWAEQKQMAVLAHDSPGYPDWEIAQQPGLLAILRQSRAHAFPTHLAVLDSGMLRPKKSLLAVFGLTRHVERVRPLTAIIPCENCSFTPCQYRRTAYRRSPRTTESEIPVFPEAPIPDAPPEPPPPLNLQAIYRLNANALKRWSAERLTLQPRPDGTLLAEFDYEGTTCSNLGRTLRFRYSVALGPRQEGYPIREQRCGPAPDDDGYTAMCSYLKDPESLMEAITQETALLGQPLDAVLAWQRPATGAGCYCQPLDRTHKWGLVLETLHYAIAQLEINQLKNLQPAGVP